MSLRGQSCQELIPELPPEGKVGVSQVRGGGSSQA